MRHWSSWGKADIENCIRIAMYMRLTMQVRQLTPDAFEIAMDTMEALKCTRDGPWEATTLKPPFFAVTT